MKRLSVLVSVVFLVMVTGCAVKATPPSLVPIAARWQQVPKDLAAPVVYSVPGMDEAQYASIPYKPGFSMDVYYPAGFRFGAKALPVVVFTMGYSADTTKAWFGADLKDLGQYVSWGALVAASGMIGVTYQTDYPDDDLAAVLEFVRGRGKSYGMDGGRIGIFTCSGNTVTGLTALTEKVADYRSGIRCGIVYYPIIAYFQNKGEQAMQVPFQRELRKDVPILFVKIGAENPDWKNAADAFVKGVDGKGFPLEVMTYEKGIHGFDTDQVTDESKQILAKTVAFLKEHLL